MSGKTWKHYIWILRLFWDLSLSIFFTATISRLPDRPGKESRRPPISSQTSSQVCWDLLPSNPGKELPWPSGCRSADPRCSWKKKNQPLHHMDPWDYGSMAAMASHWFPCAGGPWAQTGAGFSFRCTWVSTTSPDRLKIDTKRPQVEQICIVVEELIHLP